VCLTTLSIAGQWVQRAETNWPKEIVKFIGHDTAPASDLVFEKFTKKWLQGTLVLPRLSTMRKSQLVGFSGQSLRRYHANNSFVSPLLPDHLETGG
jgi:hypothetical protein